jgi:hypothetical protein
MEMELREMRGYNREVYEARVRQKYLEDCVLRALYTQKLAQNHHEVLAGLRQRRQENVKKEERIIGLTPYLRSKALAQKQAALEQAEQAYRMPQFRDLQSINERLAAANLASRGLTPASRMAKPVTIAVLTSRELQRMPENDSLMNPRNQVTDPLPEKRFLLPFAHIERRESDATEGPLSLLALLKQIPTLFDVKRNADLDAERRDVPRPALLDAVRAHLLEGGEDEGAVRERLVSLRYACALHKAHPKVALFQRMIGWANEPAWDATKSAACLLLALWLRPPEDDVTKVSRGLLGGRATPSTLAELDVTAELRLNDVEVVLRHVQRHQLVSATGTKVLRDAAAAIVLPPPPPPAPPREAPAVSIDELLVRWFSPEVWGSWEYVEDRELLMTITEKFQQPVRQRSPKSPLGIHSPHRYGAEAAVRGSLSGGAL